MHQKNDFAKAVGFASPVSRLNPISSPLDRSEGGSARCRLEGATCEGGFIWASKGFKGLQWASCFICFHHASIMFPPCFYEIALFEVVVLKFLPRCASRSIRNCRKLNCGARSSWNANSWESMGVPGMSPAVRENAWCSTHRPVKDSEELAELRTKSSTCGEM